MKLGIDASNIRTGGGITHLAALLRVVLPQAYGFNQVLVWGGTTILNRLEDRPWLRKMHDPLLDKALPLRFFWQRVLLASSPPGRVPCALCTRRVIHRGVPTVCNHVSEYIAFRVVGDPAIWRLLDAFAPHVAASLANTQLPCCGTSDISDSYARDVVMPTMQQPRTETTIISHGVGPQFMLPPRTQKPVGSDSEQHPFRILYVSIIDMYKHQWHVAEAVALLRRAGLPLQLDFIGPAYPPALKRLRQTLCRVDPIEAFLHY